MRNDLNDIISNLPAQHSLDWYRVRLGKFTGSQVGRLMHGGRGGEYFSKDALAYINEVAAERMLNEAVVKIDDLFDEYLLQTTVTNKAMAWGIDNELNAIALYQKMLGVKVTHCGAFTHESLACFASSPDGLVLEHNGTIEVKCPSIKKHTEYLCGVRGAYDLKAVDATYYWQVMAHMAVTGADWCDWMSYCPFSRKPLHVVTIMRDDDAIEKLLNQVEFADLRAQNICNQCDEAAIDKKHTAVLNVS